MEGHAVEPPVIETGPGRDPERAPEDLSVRDDHHEQLPVALGPAILAEGDGEPGEGVDLAQGAVEVEKLALQVPDGPAVLEHGDVVAEAEDIQKVRESWHMLLEKGAKNIYPSHGKSFPAEIIQRVLSK